MGQITLQIPISGQPNATEDAKVSTDFTTLQTVINGNLDDTNLVSPNNAVRRQLLQAVGYIGNTSGAGDYVFASHGYVINSAGSFFGQTLPLWAPDSGLSSQPQDFQVPGKTAYGRVRASFVTNGTGHGITLTFGLYQVTGAGGAGASSIFVTFGAALAGTTVASAANNASVESAQFTLPVTVGNPYCLGVNLSGTPSANSLVSMSAQLLAYNA